MKDLESLFTEKETSGGEIVRSFRRKFNISQKEICEVTGIKENNLSAIENGRREMGVEIAKKLAAFFGFDPSFLLFPNGYEAVFREHRKIRQKADRFFRKKKVM